VRRILLADADAFYVAVARAVDPEGAGKATLLIVGGEDRMVLDLNRAALEQLACEKRLAVVPDASHLFEEPGTLEAVARLAAGWFGRHLAGERDAGVREGVAGAPERRR